MTQDALLGEPIIKLLAILRPAGSLVALSLLCLVVGEFASGLVQRRFFDLGKLYIHSLTPENFYDSQPRGWRYVFRPMSNRAMNRVYATTQQAYTNGRMELGAGDSSADRKQAPEQVAMQALREILFLSPRLIVAKPELYAEYDRVRAESEFRDAILFPLPILTIGLLLNIHVALWVKVLVLVLILVIDIFLFLQARHQFRIAHSMVAHSLADGTITSAVIGDGQRFVAGAGHASADVDQ